MGDPNARRPTIAAARRKAMGFTVHDRLDAEDRPPHAGTPAAGNVAAEVEGTMLSPLAASRQLTPDRDPFGLMIRARRVIAPPYNPNTLTAHIEESDSLPPAIEAMATNIGGFGWELEGLFETEAEAGGEGEGGAGADGGTASGVPDAARAERERLDLFFASCAIGMGLEGLFEAVDRDVESIGYGFFEVIRNLDQEEAAFEPMPSRMCRFSSVSHLLPVACPFRDPSTGKIAKMVRWRRFRAVAQLDEHGNVSWFKEYGDPRHLNVRTGEFRPWTVERSTTGAPVLDPGEPWGIDERDGVSALDATEYVGRLCVPRSGSPYGVPRWVGASSHVVSGRRAAELPAYFLEHAPIGLFLAMVAGASWKSGQIENIVDAIKRRKGTKRAYEVLGLEAESTMSIDPTEESAKASPKFEIAEVNSKLEPTLFSGKDSLVAMTKRHVRQMFRLGPIYFGDSEAESNRAAADTAFRSGEEQVFVPIRSSRWERWVNEELFPAMGITWWRFKIRGRPFASAEDATTAIGAIDKAGGMTPNSASRLYAALTGTEPYVWGDAWADRPLALTMALLSQGIDPSTPFDEAAAEIAGRLGAGAAITDPVAGPGTDPAEDDGTTVTPSGTILNGAQVQAALAIATAVATGTLPEENAIAMYAAFFGLDTDTAAGVLRDLEGTAPAVAPPTQNVTAEPTAEPAAVDDGDGNDPEDAADAADDDAASTLEAVKRAAAAVGLEALRRRIADAVGEDGVHRLPDGWRDRL